MKARFLARNMCDPSRTWQHIYGCMPLWLFPSNVCTAAMSHLPRNILHIATNAYFIAILTNLIYCFVINSALLGNVAWRESRRCDPIRQFALRFWGRLLTAGAIECLREGTDWNIVSVNWAFSRFERLTHSLWSSRFVFLKETVLRKHTAVTLAAIG